jgi:segregation and condensation protein B
MEDIIKIKKIVEALIIVSENGISKEDLLTSIPEADLKDIGNAIDILNEDYVSQDRAFNIVQIAGRYRVSTKPEFMPWISNLYQKTVEKLSGPSLETLAILAYKQPATRAEIEAIRGVNAGGVLKALLERDLVRVKGRRDTLGRPLLYETTEKFLELFGLSSLDELPKLREFEESDLDFRKSDENILLKIDKEDQDGHETAKELSAEDNVIYKGEQPLGNVPEQSGDADETAEKELKDEQPDPVAAGEETQRDEI